MQTWCATSKNEQAKRDFEALDAFTNDVVARVEQASDPAAGLDWVK